MISTIRVSKTEDTTEKLSKWKKCYGPHNLRSPLLFPGIFCWCSFIPPETSVQQIRDKKLLLGGYPLAGARKFAFAGSCHQETDYALPKGDQVFAIPTYRKVWPPSTLGRSVCGYMEAAPFAVLGLFEIIKSRPMLLPLNCSEALSASLRKRIIGIESPVIHWTASLGGGIVGIKTPVIHLTVSLGGCIVRIKPSDTLDRF